MALITKEEQLIVRRWKALPLSFLKRRIDEMLDSILEETSEMKMKPKIEAVKELRRWVHTIEEFSKKDKQTKKDSGI